MRHIRALGKDVPKPATEPSKKCTDDSAAIPVAVSLRRSIRVVYGCTVRASWVTMMEYEGARMYYTISAQIIPILDAKLGAIVGGRSSECGLVCL